MRIRMTKEEYVSAFSKLTEKLENTHILDYEILFLIAESFVKPYVFRLCDRYPVLKEQSLQEDVYHDVLLCLIKYSVDKFFYKNEAINTDPDGYLKWIYTVSRNAVINTARKQNYRSINEYSLNTDENEIQIADPDDVISGRESAERLRECFRCAVFSDSAIYMILVWLLRALLLSGAFPVLNDEDADRSKINGYIAENYSDDLLDAIYAGILIASKSLSWMDFNSSARSVMSDRLSAQFEGGTFGEAKLKRFYMKKGGPASISDWVNRMNGRILGKVNGQ